MKSSRIQKVLQEAMENEFSVKVSFKEESLNDGDQVVHFANYDAYFAVEELAMDCHGKIVSDDNGQRKMERFKKKDRWKKLSRTRDIVVKFKSRDDKDLFFETMMERCLKYKESREKWGLSILDYETGKLSFPNR